MSIGAVTRARTIDNWRPVSGGEQLLLKVTSAARKTIKGVRELAAYVARTHQTPSSPKLDLDLLDEVGEVVGSEEIRERLKDWALIPDNENLRPAARDRLQTGQDIRSLSGKARYWRNQAYHLIWSQTSEGTGDPHDLLRVKMEHAAREFVFSEFAENGHRVLWAIHEDHQGRPHVHFIVKARSDRGRQLRITREVLEDMRARLGAFARREELNVLAERREDRRFLLDQILDGSQPLRANSRLISYQKKTDPASQVPLWFAEEGRAWLERKIKSARPKPLPGPAPVKPAILKQWPEDFRPLLNAFAGIYIDPAKALSSYLKMVSGDGSPGTKRSLALWYLRKQPLAFGELAEHEPAARDRAADIAKSLATVPSVNWGKHRDDPQQLAQLHSAFARQKAAGQSLASVLAGLRRLRRQLIAGGWRNEKLSGVNQRIEYVRDWQPISIAPDPEKGLPRRIVDFIQRKTLKR